MFQRSTPELAYYFRLWPLSSCGQQLGTADGRHNEFMTVFSHELRNFLGAIRSVTHILRMETSAGPAAAKARALIERQVGQMSRLVEDLLDVSRVRTGHLRLQCERIDLCAVAAHAAQSVDFAMQQIRVRGAGMRASVSGSPWCAVWSNGMVAASPLQALASGAEASSRFACRCLRSSCASVGGQPSMSSG